MSQRDPRQDDAFAEHAREQRERWLRLTPEERLLWLERAKQFVRIAQAAGRPVAKEREK